MTATEAFKAGKLAEAVAAGIEQVRNNPADRGKRMFLAELFVFAGDLERADKQLDMLFQPDAPDLMTVTLFRQLLRGETARREVFAQGRLPDFIAQPPEHVKQHLEAAIHLRENRPAEAAFDDFRDLDDLTAPVFEVITANGNYYWVPIETVELVEFHKPERTRDLFWRPTHMIVNNGPDGVVYVSTLYPGSHASANEAMKLGRGTDWTGGDGTPYRGTGMREFLVGDAARAIMELTQIEFKRP